MNMKRNEGYVLPFVMIVLAVLCLVAVSTLPGALRNINYQQDSWKPIKEEYQGDITHQEKVWSSPTPTPTSGSGENYANVTELPSNEEYQLSTTEAKAEAEELFDLVISELKTVTSEVDSRTGKHPDLIGSTIALCEKNGMVSADSNIFPTISPVVYKGNSRYSTELFFTVFCSEGTQELTYGLTLIGRDAEQENYRLYRYVNHSLELKSEVVTT